MALDKVIGDKIAESAQRKTGIKFYRLDEARSVPRRREELHPKTTKHLGAKKEKLEKAMGLIKRAVKHLEDMPHTDFMGDVPHWIEELELVLHGEDGRGGMENILTQYAKEHRKSAREDKARAKYEEELHGLKETKSLRDIVEARTYKSDADREFAHEEWEKRMAKKFRDENKHIGALDTYLDNADTLKRELLRSVGLTPKQAAPFLVLGRKVQKWVDETMKDEVYFSPAVANSLDEMEGKIWGEMNDLKGYGTKDDALVSKWLKAYTAVAEKMMDSTIDFDDWLASKKG